MVVAELFHNGIDPPDDSQLKGDIAGMILLTTLNARYIHASFGLRYLQANMDELREQCEILEFDINQRPLETVERLLARQPRIIGIGVYIWNDQAGVSSSIHSNRPPIFPC